MEQSSFQLFSEVTKPLFQLKQATMNFTHFMVPLAPSIIISSKHIMVHLLLLLSLPFWEVCLSFWHNLWAHMHCDTADKAHANNPKFYKFWQLFHSLLLHILSSLKPGMTTLEVVHCFDDHFWWAIYSLVILQITLSRPSLLVLYKDGVHSLSIPGLVFKNIHLIDCLDVLQSQMILMEEVDAAVMSTQKCSWMNLN